MQVWPADRTWFWNFLSGRGHFCQFECADYENRRMYRLQTEADVERRLQTRFFSNF